MEDTVNEKLLRGVRRAEEVVDEEMRLKDRLWTEAKKMWVVAGPAIFTRFSSCGVGVISQAFIGHIGSTELAAYALVSTVLLRFANGILLGMASALETLCGQSCGAKQYDMLGVYLQRSWLILLMCSIVLTPVFIFTTPILIALGQDQAIAEVAGTISLWLIPVIFSFILSFTCQMFLQAQSKNIIIAYLAAFTLVIHVFLSWLLTVKYKFGLSGAMVSTILAFWIPNIGQLVYIFGGWCSETWKGFSMLAFKDLWPIIKLSLSSGVMLCLELWYNTVLVLLTGNLDDTALSALLSLLPHHSADLLSQVDQPLQVLSDIECGREFILCEYNRDADSYRSPWSNKYHPPLEDGPYPSSELRKLEIEANDVFAVYCEQYYEGGISSVYMWEDENEGFVACFLIKKDGSKSGHGRRGYLQEGAWDAIHVVEVGPDENGTAHYCLTSTVMLSLTTNNESSGSFNLSGSIRRQMNMDLAVAEGHLQNMGKMIEELEGKLRNSLDQVYFGKTKEMVCTLRPPAELLQMRFPHHRDV